MPTIDHTNLHRTAKYFMDNGRVATHDEALMLLEQFGLTIFTGEEIAQSVHHQTALLTLVNTARRTLLGGIHVHGLPDCATVTPLMPGMTLVDAVRKLGGIPIEAARRNWPAAVIGSGTPEKGLPAAWRVTWEGWRGGAVPVAHGIRLDESNAMALAPIAAAAVCAAEAFAFHAKDHAMAGKRAAGLSLWRLSDDWLKSKNDEPVLAFLPSRLWVIGLGNLGQAFAWLLAALPYGKKGDVEFLLQDFDSIAESNDSTSLLSFRKDIGRKKTRVVSGWLEARGFEPSIEERRFGSWTQRHEQEPGLALCGVDNGQARAALEDAGFDLVIEVGLGGGPQAFRSMSLHTFPASRSAKEIWGTRSPDAGENFEDMPAYRALKNAGMDQCGLAQLASRTVGVPFVGLIAASIAISEILRRLHGAAGLEFASGSAASLEDFESGTIETPIFSHGYVPAAG